MIEIKEKKYLREFPWPPPTAYLILSYGDLFTNLSDLEEGIDEKLDLPVEMAGWTFDEIVCLAMAFFFKDRTLTVKEWSTLFRYLFFAENLKVRQTIYVLKKKNEFFFQPNKHDVYCGGVLCLTRNLLEGVSKKDLNNALNFLEITEVTKKDLISSCLTLNSYNPLILYMQKMKNSLSKI